MSTAVLTISSRNYSSWSLRGWLMTKRSGIEFEERVVAPGDPEQRAELLMLSSSIRVPHLVHDGIKIWDTLAIGEYLNEIAPDAQLMPADRAARARCRSISGEMHSGFAPLRSALSMNIKGNFPNYKVWSRAQADIDRITEIWRECLGEFGGPYLFGAFSLADAMYAPVVTRFKTYHVPVDPVSAAYAERIRALPEMREWIAEALTEDEAISELEF